ncbi:MAG TPA: TIGR04283 family arsenosugar biosynthesis glycosyltransferase [Chthoniobacterales bacterium]|nr:TIGR04283 family arsenosugar biosynthesis glycosyltransferase [Chthoniobacterales bacterium]
MKALSGMDERRSSTDVSIVVPVLNEAALIRQFLMHLRERAPGAEIIVVDGGSTDTTAKIAEESGARVMHARRNRAVQMNAGAQIARGDILWFLHVDLTVPAGCLDQIACSLADPKTVGGFFRIRLPRPGFIYRLTDEFAHYAGILLRMRCGDHGFFCRRRDFFALGGFPEVPLMEDVAFFRLLRRRGHVCVSKTRIVANDRRYQVVGPTRLTFAYGLIGLLYIFGASLSFLSRIYDRLCCRRHA